MRINEYNTLSEFTDEFIGEWSPSNEHWWGLEFRYCGVEYRLHTGTMYKEEETVLEDGRPVMFGLYRMKKTDGVNCTLIGRYGNMDELLNSYVINGKPFRDIITDDLTEILGKD